MELIDPKHLLTTPRGIAISISVFLVSTLIIIGAAIGGSYALTLESIHHNNQVVAAQNRHNNEIAVRQANALKIREAESSVRTSIPTCRALIQMDDAKRGAVNASSSPNSYGHKLAKAITHVVNGTRCRLLISAVDSGVPISTIAREFDKAGVQ